MTRSQELVRWLEEMLWMLDEPDENPYIALMEETMRDYFALAAIRGLGTSRGRRNRDADIAPR